jgi:thiamine pyrophosphokinase
MKALMISGGVTSSEMIQTVYKDYNPNMVVAIDGGCKSALNASVPLDLAYGDFDTLEEDNFSKLEPLNIEVIRLSPIKNVTDTHGALLELQTRGVKEVVILGATGTRMDHTLANLMLSFSFLDTIKIIYIDANNHIQAFSGPTTIQGSKGEYKYLSILPITNIHIQSTTGLKYPIQNKTLTPYSSLGISNEITTPYQITLTQGNLLLIQSKD